MNIKINRRLLVIVSFIICQLSFNSVAAQELWITGSAVPGGVQKLVMGGDGDYKYAGTLKEGEVRIMTTKKAGKATRYLVPILPDALIANKGLAYQETTDAKAATWQVPVTEDRYRFTVDTRNKVVRGEIFQPWGELFIGGGATENGWKEGKMQLMTQNLTNPFIWTWEGELKRHPEYEEPASFKFQGQDRWYPKNLHPYVQGADILTDTRLRIGGSDTKWVLSQDGRYRITIDLLHETVKAEILK